MKLSPAEQESIVGLLTRIYFDICEVENQFQLLVGGGDFRPRIEYFHDAIRAFTSDSPGAREAGGRLSVEFLAYDLKCLRYLQERPLSSFTPHEGMLSTRTDLIKPGGQPVPTNARPDRVAKERIAELYQRYAVLFAALLKPFADADFNDRADDLNQDVGDIRAIADIGEKLLEGRGSESDLESLIAHLNDDELRQELFSRLERGELKTKSGIKKLIQALKETSRRKDKEIFGIEKAHMEYALAQLALYETSKDMIKKLAGQGMNLVGKFVEAQVADTRREMGR